MSSDIVAFPDDDCSYPPGLLQRVAERLTADPDLDGLTGRAEDASGASSASWKADAAVLTDDNLWNRAISYTIFLRRAVVEQVGAFDGASVWARPGRGRRGGDRLPDSRRPGRSPDRVRPVARRSARRAGRHHANRSSRRRERRVPAPQARVPEELRRAHARATTRRHRRLARANGSRSCLVHARRFAAGFAATAGRAARRPRDDGRATARASSARPPSPAQPSSTGVGRSAHGRPHRRAPRRWAARPAPSRPVRDADPGHVSDELDRPSTRGMDDRGPARHRLDHERRAGVVHLRVQENVSSPEDSRRIALCVFTEEMNAVSQAELVHERLG